MSARSELVHYAFPKIHGFGEAAKDLYKRFAIIPAPKQVVTDDGDGDAATKTTETKTKTKTNKKRRLLVLHGLVKMHGTNAGLVERSDGTLYGQGRNRVLAPGRGNQFEFVEFYSAPKRAAVIHEMFSTIRALCAKGNTQVGIPKINEPVTIVYYGEFCGPKIQKGVAISLLPERAFFGFAIKVEGETTKTTHWLNLRQIGAALHEPRPPTPCPSQSRTMRPRQRRPGTATGRSGAGSATCSR